MGGREREEEKISGFDNKAALIHNTKDEQGPSSRTQKVHGQNDLSEAERGSSGGGHASRIRSLYELGGRSDGGGEKDWREKQHRNGCGQRKLGSHAGSNGTNLISLHSYKRCYPPYIIIIIITSFFFLNTLQPVRSI